MLGERRLDPAVDPQVLRRGVLAGVGDRLLRDAEQLGLDVDAQPAWAPRRASGARSVRTRADLAHVVGERGAEAAASGDSLRRSKIDSRSSVTTRVSSPRRSRSSARWWSRARSRAPGRRRRSRARRSPGRRRRGSRGPAAAAPRRWPATRTSSKTSGGVEPQRVVVDARASVLRGRPWAPARRRRRHGADHPRARRAAGRRQRWRAVARCRRLGSCMRLHLRRAGSTTGRREASAGWPPAVGSRADEHGARPRSEQDRGVAVAEVLVHRSDHQLRRTTSVSRPAGQLAG